MRHQKGAPGEELVRWEFKVRKWLYSHLIEFYSILLRTLDVISAPRCSILEALCLIFGGDFAQLFWLRTTLPPRRISDPAGVYNVTKTSTYAELPSFYCILVPIFRLEAHQNGTPTRKCWPEPHQCLMRVAFSNTMVLHWWITWARSRNECQENWKYGNYFFFGNAHVREICRLAQHEHVKKNRAPSKILQNSYLRSKTDFVKHVKIPCTLSQICAKT